MNDHHFNLPLQGKSQSKIRGHVSKRCPEGPTRRYVSLKAASEDAKPSDDVPPELKGDWREFRAGLLSRSPADKATSARKYQYMIPI